jgi:hypothetical protein
MKDLHSKAGSHQAADLARRIGGHQPLLSTMSMPKGDAPCRSTCLPQGVVLIAAIFAVWVGIWGPPAVAKRPPPPPVPVAPVSQTGQTTCWETTGSPTNCARTGQDGNIQAGVAWPIPRFTDHSNGTVTDNLTGLIWLKDANCFDVRS